MVSVPVNMGIILFLTDNNCTLSVVLTHQQSVSILYCIKEDISYRETMRKKFSMNFIISAPPVIAFSAKIYRHALPHPI